MLKFMLVSLSRDIASPPLGLASIATYLRHDGIECEVRIADVNFCRPLREIVKWRPDLVGISAFSVQMPRAVRLARGIRKRIEVPLILGGVHISTLPQSLPPEFTLGVVGEGERTASDLLRAFAIHGHLGPEVVKDIPGLAYRVDGAVTLTAPRSPAEPLDRIPIPDRSFLESGYFGLISLPQTQARRVRTTALLTGRGCPYRCAFCSTSRFWGTRIRWHSTERVAEEVQMLVENHGIEHVTIWDDLFAIKRSRVVELTSALRQAGLLGRVSFSCQMRANLMSEEMATALHELGVVSICFGFESGSDRTLEYLKQSATVEQNRKAAALAKGRGFYVTGGVVFGSPGESLEEMERTLELMDDLAKIGVDNVWCFSATPFPGTPMWSEGLRRGVLSDGMDFSELNLYRSVPLLLDPHVAPARYSALMRRARNKGRRIRWKRFPLRLRLLAIDPMNTLRSYLIRHLHYNNRVGR